MARTWSTPALAVLCTAGVVLLGGTAIFLASLFLEVAPTNALSQRYRSELDQVVYPEFEQNWKLFAPNPLQQNLAVDARVQTISATDQVHTRDWIGLTAQDIAAIRGNPAPSHVDQNMLRRAWDFYDSTHTAQDGTVAVTVDAERAQLAEEYLKRIGLQRLGRTQGGERVLQIQFRQRTVDIAPPSWSAEQTPGAVADRVLPWWPVDDSDYQGLG
ncbi:DUF5819 family protein [Kitasatospora sp. MAP5-34]|uniref:DUF5819 family protein n=1 Tax=Kitasatospora sp. MAP5-34 TaxID=3035102 RepID=UPI002476BF67|nr:DUF5819 family protein [Kitasatospora sp. MAP5-34]MDH6576428.1 hypothetical protein [Kitasatospora sp. MAP5-34]